MTAFKFLAISFFFLLASCKAQPQKGQALMFYNVENLFDIQNTNGEGDAEFQPNSRKEWTQERYQEKVKALQKSIAEFGSIGIMGLCEVENKKVVEDLLAPYEYLKIVHEESQDFRGIDVALAYDSRLFEKESHEILRFKLRTDEGEKTTRDILCVKLENDTETIYVLVNHWPSRRGGQEKTNRLRVKAASMACEYIDNILNNDLKAQIVLMGDLNDFPENEGPSMIAERLEPMIDKKSGKFPGTYNYKGNWNLLDHIFVSKSFMKKDALYVGKNTDEIGGASFLFEVYKGNIVPFRTYAGPNYLGGTSDHLPVSVRLLSK